MNAFNAADYADYATQAAILSAKATFAAEDAGGSRAAIKCAIAATLDAAAMHQRAAGAAQAAGGMGETHVAAARELADAARALRAVRPSKA